MRNNKLLCLSFKKDKKQKANTAAALLEKKLTGKKIFWTIVKRFFLTK